MAAIVKTPDVLGGKARLDGRRVSVYQTGESYVEVGRTPEEIADQLDCSLAAVHASRFSPTNTSTERTSRLRSNEYGVANVGEDGEAGTRTEPSNGIPNQNGP